MALAACERPPASTPSAPSAPFNGLGDASRVASSVLDAPPAGSLQSTPAVTPSDLAAAAAGNTAFAFDLYKQLAATPGNLFLSPLSIRTALGMAYAGARGKTASDMQAALHFDAPAALHPSLQALATGAESDASATGNEIEVANALWLAKGVPLLPSFTGTLQTNYGAPPTLLDLTGAAQASADTINQWASTHTHGRILSIVAADDVKSSLLILTNAVYFKGTWAEPFEAEQTSPRPFHLGSTPDLQVPVMMMSATLEDARLYEDKDVQVLELPYAGGTLVMDVVLPTSTAGSGAGLGAIEETLSPDRLATWTTGMSAGETIVALPRWTSTWSANVTPNLAALGMGSATHPGADLSGTDGGQNQLFISAVIHKAFIGVDEHGTEAAAVTAIGEGAGAAPPSSSHRGYSPPTIHSSTCCATAPTAACSSWAASSTRGAECQSNRLPGPQAGANSSSVSVQ
jgi:serpin B